jgi:sugar phosphate isomerase/epimerase
MPSLPDLSVQLYSVRTHLADDLPGTLARLADIGLRQVEPFDLIGDPEGLRSALDAHGLTAPSAHARLLGPEVDLEAVLAAAETVGVGTVIAPVSDAAQWVSSDGVRAIADDLGRAAEAAAAHGIRVGYHNHAFELENTVDGRPALEFFAELLDPRIVLEVDTYWAAVGGQQVPDLLGRLGDRVKLVHLKDGPITKVNDEQLPLGAGAMPVPEIVAAAASVEILVLEFDDYAGDLFDGIAQSFEYAASLRVGS